MVAPLSDLMILNGVYELQIFLALDADVPAHLTSYLILKKLFSLFIGSFIFNPFVLFKNDFQCKNIEKDFFYRWGYNSLENMKAAWQRTIDAGRFAKDETKL
jgi:hypothetical protein